MKKRSFLQGFNPVKMQMVEPLAADGKSMLLGDPVAADGKTVILDTVDDRSISSGQVPVPQSSVSIRSSVLGCGDGGGGGRVRVDGGSCGVDDELGRGGSVDGSRAVIQAPPSPNANRQRFLNGFIPARTCCNLDLCRAPADSKFNLTAICLAVYPPSKNPDRRYVQLCDDTGSTGITVWNSNVAKFNSASVGKLITCVKVAMSNYNGKRTLTMTRDSSIQIVNDPQHSVMVWWSNLLQASPKSCGSVHDMPDGSIVSVTGILGLVSEEVKMVNSVERSLTYLHLVDATGRIDVRSWNHTADSFLRFVDSPVCIQRVRVTSFAGTKVLELLDADTSVVVSDFPGKDALLEFWST